MTRLKEPMAKTPNVSASETEAPAADVPVYNEPPKLSALHEKTRNVIGKVLGKDAKTFDELARAQKSGQ